MFGSHNGTGHARRPHGSQHAVDFRPGPQSHVCGPPILAVKTHARASVHHLRSPSKNGEQKNINKSFDKKY
jgi:hypothetical protein